MRSDLNLILEQLTDPDNEAPIELENDRGEIARFSQMALIPITAPSEEFEEEMVDHHFALLHPLDEKGHEVGDLVVFDFIVDENEQVHVTLVDDPYVLRDLIALFRQRGRQADLEAEEVEVETEECESIFGGTIVSEVQANEDKLEAVQKIEELEQELRSDVAPKKEKEKKSFFGKLFGKK